MIPEVIALGGLIWSYCSIKCQQKIVVKTFEEIEKTILECEKCQDAPGPEFVVPVDPTPFVAPETNLKSAKLEVQIKKPETCEPQPTQPLPSTEAQSSRNANSKCKPHRCKLGKITNNSFFNFMRENRRLNKCMKPEIAAVLWRNLNYDEKLRYQKKNYKSTQQKISCERR